MSTPPTSNSLQKRAKREAQWLRLWQSRSVLTRVLYPFSWLFQNSVRLRQLAFSRHWRAQYRAPIPVVVVGGMMVGGVGKTPVVARLTRDLLREGFHPVIISRGYGGGNDANPHEPATQVTAQSLASEVGDEPLQLALNTGLPVWVGADRVAVTRAVCAAHPQCDVIVCDDGLQHYRLARDIELLVMDDRGLGNGWCLPAGPLREPPTRLHTVSAIVQHTRGEARDVHMFAWMPVPLSVPQFAVHSVLGEAYALLEPQLKKVLNTFAEYKVLRCAGIARPEVFFELLASEGLSGEVLALPDHAPFSDELMRALQSMDFEVLLLTEKDAVKCLPWQQAYPELVQRIWVVPLEIVPDADWLKLSQQIVVRLRTMSGSISTN